MCIFYTNVSTCTTGIYNVRGAIQCLLIQGLQLEKTKELIKLHVIHY